MIRHLGLAGEQIEFIGCSNYSFSADGFRAGRKFSARITYPLRGEPRFRSDHLVPLAHELGHVVQLRETGSRQRLLTLLDSHSVELGADFLAGTSVRALGVGLNITDFAANLDLVGQFTPSHDYHGKPISRSNAFRRGFHYVDHESVASAERMHLTFQSNIHEGVADEEG